MSTDTLEKTVNKHKSPESQTEKTFNKCERDIDEAALESFPASDPPAWVNRSKNPE